MDIVPLFCELDEFCCQFEPWLACHQLSQRQRQRRSTMYLSEVMTILVLFHLLGYRNLKQFYTEYVTQHLRWAFPRLVSYTRFVELQGEALLPLCAYLRTRRGTCTGISFIDSTPLTVCHNRRIASHRVFADQAARGKGSLGWFYGFKLHLVVNDEGALLACCLTPGNVDDRTPAPALLRNLWGKLFADKGYLAQWLFDALFTHHLQLVTKLKKNMANKLLPYLDKLLLRKRAIIETITDQLKNISQIEHTRHRSFWNFLGNLVAGLIAYTWRPTKPSLGLRPHALALPDLLF
jgi:transposase